MNEVTKPFVEAVAERLIQQLEAGVAPWQKPWIPGESSASMPTNPVTGSRYKGINALQLMSQDHTDNRWMTYKQATSIGAQVRKGEKGTPIQYWKFSEEQTQTDINDKPLLDAEGKTLKKTVQLERPALFMATVFNAEQIDGLPSLQSRKEPAWNPSQRAEAILQATGASIEHGESDRAFYRYATDKIHLPDKSQFESGDRYYATALHELGHWTGHHTRLDRDLAHPFGSEAYAREELRAEIASMILGEELGIGHDPGQHAAYVASWIKAIKDDPLEIFRAAADAEKIQTYVLGLEQKFDLQNHEAEQIAEFVAENCKLHPAQIIQNTLEADTGLKNILADETKMEVLNARVNALLQSVNRSYIDEVKAAITSSFHQTNPDDDATLQTPALDAPTTASDADLDDAQLVADFIAENLSRDHADVAVNVVSAPPLLKSLLADDWRVKSLDLQVNQLLHNLNQANIDETQAIIATALGRGAAGLARAHEESLKNNSQTSIDDLNAAKVAREGAEANLVMSESDLVRQIAQDLQMMRTESDIDQQGAFIDGTQGVTAGQGRLELESADKLVARADTVAQDPIKLAVPYAERSAAKAAGAVWDKTARSWSVGPDADLLALARWKVDSDAVMQTSATSPREEFSAVLRAAGCVVADNHPVMDGNKHRIATVGGQSGEQTFAGEYQAQLVGHPHGYVRNDKTGTEVTWKAKGYTLDAEKKSQLRTRAASKLRDRSAEKTRRQEQAADRAAKQIADLQPMTTSTPYLQSKGLMPTSGVFTDRENRMTFLPAMDASGKHWATQAINEDGSSEFTRDSRKAGCFHAVGGMEELARAPALVIATSYATANTLAMSLGHATVAAFEPSNLRDVAVSLHRKYPEKPVIIAGDNDQFLEAPISHSVGKGHAQEAAGLTGGRLVLPIFAPGEVASSNSACASFNDLAHRSKLGAEGVDRQIRTAVAGEIVKAQAESELQSQQQSHVRGQRHSIKMG